MNNFCNKYLMTVIMILSFIVFILIYTKSNNEPKFRFVGTDYWNHTADALTIMVNIKTNELYLENSDGTNMHVWIRPETNKPVMLGEDLPVEH